MYNKVFFHKNASIQMRGMDISEKNAIVNSLAQLQKMNIRRLLKDPISMRVDEDLYLIHVDRKIFALVLNNENFYLVKEFVFQDEIFNPIGLEPSIKSLLKLEKLNPGFINKRFKRTMQDLDKLINAAKEGQYFYDRNVTFYWLNVLLSISLIITLTEILIPDSNYYVDVILLLYARMMGVVFILFSGNFYSGEIFSPHNKMQNGK